MIPLILICWVKVKFQKPLWKEFLVRFISIGISVIVLLAIFVSCYENYASFGRNNRYIRYLINPSNYIISTIRVIKHSYINSIPYKKLGLDAKDLNRTSKKKNIVILIVGETSRSANYSLNGYPRDTNPLLSKQKVISFKDFRSCGTATAVSLPCMFSNMTRKNYSADRAQREDSLLDVLKHAHINLLWRDNDEGCKGVCRHVPSQDMTALNLPKYCSEGTCYDSILLRGLKAYIKRHQHQDTLIVLHLIGSHGPNYYHRYPKQFDEFKPTCNRDDIQNCSHQSLVNVYDNTILYTDYTVNSVIKLLKQFKSENTAMIYLSDHGEALGEHGFYLHGMPYFIAPKQVTTVPFIVWLSKDMIHHHKINMACLRKESQQSGYSQDYLYNSILSLMNIKVKMYNTKLDLFNNCYDRQLRVKHAYSKMK